MCDYICMYVCWEEDMVVYAYAYMYGGCLLIYAAIAIIPRTAYSKL